MGKFLPGVKISMVHGQMRKIDGRFVIAMFHPAAALHQPQLKPSILADFAKLPQLLDLARTELAKTIPVMSPAQITEPKLMEAPSETEAPKQMKLF